MKAGTLLIEVDWKPLAFLAGIMAAAIWYFFDARASSASTENLILVGPLTLAMLVVAAGQIPGLVRIHRVEPGEPVRAPQRPPLAVPSLVQLRRAAEKTPYVTMALFVAYILSLPYAGLDVGTFVFLVATQFALGERRWWFLLATSLGISAVLAFGFRSLLMMPMPMLVL